MANKLVLINKKNIIKKINKNELEFIRKLQIEYDFYK